MRIYLFITIMAATISFGFNQISFAGCNENPANTFTCTDDPPNPDLVGIQQDTNNNSLTMDLLPGSIINTTAASTIAIDVGNGNNQLTMNHAQVITLADDNGIEFGNGSNILEINDSEVRCEEDCLDMGNGSDNINIVRSIIESLDNNGIDANAGNDVITVIDSQVLAGPQCCNNFGITLGDGDDQLTVINSRVAGFTMNQPIPSAITMQSGNNTVRLGTGAQIDGLISCNDSTDFDTLIFAMEVPDSQLETISNQLATKNPDGDSIAINGLFYEWENCDNIVNELVGGFISPVPTLSQWGLIAMAGILGIVGFMVMRRRSFMV